eukprot:8478631-Pyramimonas_sp.AAC.1
MTVGSTLPPGAAPLSNVTHWTHPVEDLHPSRTEFPHTQPPPRTRLLVFVVGVVSSPLPRTGGGK